MDKPKSGPPSDQLNLPAGFRFHPTDEELVVNYLAHKAESRPFAIPIIAEIDLYKFDPWELPEKALFGEREWYFFSPRDRKYPNGARPNRAAASGYWKATGTDKPIQSRNKKVGVKKALVFYKGKAPKGIKTNWIMHEYRLADAKAPLLPARKKGSLRLDDWVLCRIYKKSSGAFKVMVSSNAPRATTTAKLEPEEELDDVLASLPDIDMDHHRFKIPQFSSAAGGGAAGAAGGNGNSSNHNNNPNYFAAHSEEMFSPDQQETSENATSGSFDHSLSYHPSSSLTNNNTNNNNNRYYSDLNAAVPNNLNSSNTMVMMSKVNPWAYDQMLQQTQMQLTPPSPNLTSRIINPPPIKLEKVPSNISDILLQIQHQNAALNNPAAQAKMMKRPRVEDEDDVQSTCRSPVPRARQGFGFDLSALTSHHMLY